MEHTCVEGDDDGDGGDGDGDGGADQCCCCLDTIVAFSGFCCFRGRVLVDLTSLLQNSCCCLHKSLAVCSSQWG